MRPDAPLGPVTGPARLADFSVRHWQFTVVIFAMLAALGVSSWRGIPRGEDPTFPAPIFTAVAVYPGASPKDVEETVAQPIEERLRALDRVKRVRTRVTDGLAAVQVEFEVEADADEKEAEVQRELSALRPSLPAALHSLQVEKYSSSEVNVVQVALASEAAPMHELEALGERLEDRFSAVRGVRTAALWGVREREVRVSLDLGRLAQHRVPAAQVLAALGGESATIPGGSLDVGGRRFNVRTGGAFDDVEEVRNTVVGGGGGAVVRPARRGRRRLGVRRRHAPGARGRAAGGVRDRQPAGRRERGAGARRAVGGARRLRAHAPAVREARARLRPVGQREPASGAAGGGLRDRAAAGAGDAAPAGDAGVAGGDDLDPAVAGHRRRAPARHGGTASTSCRSSAR
jgi:hypothetical protein